MDETHTSHDSHPQQPQFTLSSQSMEKASEHASQRRQSLTSLSPWAAEVLLTGNPDGLKRDLSNRKVQLVAIGGSIGTALFLSIGGTLNKSGPGSLFLGFLTYNIFLALANNCMAEMSVYMPVTGGFLRMAGKWCDESLGFMVGWNFFFYQVIVIPFEITALSLVVSYWNENIPVVAICGGCIAIYFFLNVFTVAIYGEAEFWLSSGKCFLLFMLLSFTFVTMVGGNPQRHAYGFSNWQSGQIFKEVLSGGKLGQFEGFLSVIWAASFTCVGPEYVSMMAAEAQHPRVYLKQAYKFVYWRILLFFVGGALAVGILVKANDPTLDAIFSAGTGGSSGSSAASPYIIAMKNMGIRVLPHIVTALLATTIFSAGNTYCYCATRSLYGLALEGRAPRVLQRCTKRGVPIYCFLIVMLFPFLSFLQVSNSSAKVLEWLINLATGCTVINYIVICITYICFYRACVAQRFDRSQLPYYARFQPYSAWIVLVFETCVALVYGYSSFSPFDVTSFLIYYTMVILAPVLFIVWKLIHKTKWLSPDEVDLVWDAPFFTAYEAACEDRPVGFFRDVYNSFFHVKQRKAKGSTPVSQGV